MRPVPAADPVIRVGLDLVELGWIESPSKIYGFGVDLGWIWGVSGLSVHLWHGSGWIWNGSGVDLAFVRTSALSENLSKIDRGSGNHISPDLHRST